MITMETLVVVDQHKNERYTRISDHGPARFGSFVASRGFKDINCQTFESGSGIGILPTPFKAGPNTVTNRACSSSPKTPEESKPLKKPVKSSAIPIPINIKADHNIDWFFNDEFAYSELWAGPAYSNSPPPSSLPMPKFSLPPKRTASLNLPASPAVSDMDFHPIAKSAPPSPTRDHSKPSSRDLFHSADSATETLRRILNVDMADE